MYELQATFHAEADNRSSRRLLRTNAIITIFLISAFQYSCCRQSFSYPVIVDVTKIEVTANSSAQVMTEITDNSQINRIIRFIDERRSRWCSPYFGSLPEPPLTLSLQIRNNGKGRIGFGKRFFVAEFSGGHYKMDLSDDEVRDFFGLIGVREESVLR